MCAKHCMSQLYAEHAAFLDTKVIATEKRKRLCTHAKTDESDKNVYCAFSQIIQLQAKRLTLKLNSTSNLLYFKTEFSFARNFCYLFSVNIPDVSLNVARFSNEVAFERL